MALLALVVAALAATCASARSIGVSVAAPWPTSSVSAVQEAAEACAETSNALLWSFADALAALPAPERAELDAAATSAAYSAADAERVLDLASATAGSLFSRLGADTLGLTLSARAYAPAVEARRASAGEVAASGCAAPLETGWAVARGACGAVACSPAGLEGLLADRACAADGDRVPGARAHGYPGAPAGDGAPHVTLFALVGSERFLEWHAALAAAADAGLCSYALRHAPAPASATVDTALQGYGVNLDLKNMEYKNIDDGGATAGAGDQGAGAAFAPGEAVEGVVLDTLLQREPSKGAQLKELGEALVEASEGAGLSLKAWDLKDLGLQATASIVEADDPLAQLEELSQNFPLHAKALSGRRIDARLEDDVAANAQVVATTLARASGGEAATILVNGVGVDVGSPSFSLFSLLKTVRSEARQVEKVAALNLPADKVTELLALGARPLGAAATSVRIEMVTGSRYAVGFLNNLERDRVYEQMESSLRPLLYPAYQLHSIAKNLYTMVLVLDPLAPDAKQILGTVMMMYQQGYPLRYGVVLTSTDELSRVRRGLAPTPPSADQEPKTEATATDVAALFGALKQSQSPLIAWQFLLEAVLADVTLVTRGDLVKAYASSVVEGSSSWSSSMRKHEEEAWSVLTGDLGAAAAANATKFVASKGLPVGCAVLNGMIMENFDPQGQLLNTIMQEQQFMGELVSAGIIGDRTRSIYATIFKSIRGVYSTYHPLINEAPADQVFVELVKDAPGTVAAAQSPSDKLLASLAWVRGPGTSAAVTPASFIVAADLGSAAGVRLARDAFRYLAAADAADGAAAPARVALVHNPSSAAAAIEEVSPAALLAAVAALASGKHDGSAAFLAAALAAAADGEDAALAARRLVADADDDAALPHALPARAAAAVVSALSAAPADAGAPDPAALGLAEGQAAVFCNGRRVLVTAEQPYALADFGLLASIEVSSRGHEVMAVLDDVPTAPDATPDDASDAIMAAASFLGVYSQSSRVDVDAVLEQHIRSSKRMVVDFPSAGSALDVTAVLNPLSEAAQRAAPLLRVMRDELGLRVRVLLMPQLEISEFPLSKFYRYVVGSDDVAPQALFSDLPKRHILTLRMDVPGTWNVQASRAVQDLDNIRCDGVMCGDESGSSHSAIEYTLKNLILGGQCYESRTRVPPNGLQLRLLDDRDASLAADTLVMQNLGYFQVAASPGAYEVAIADGRGAQLFELLDGDAPAASQAVLVESFYDRFESLRVRKRKGFEDVPLMQEFTEGGDDPLAEVDLDAEGGYAGAPTSAPSWSSLGLFGGKGASAVAASADPDETIHVFSLATGHLYERMLKIMMLSVRKRTSGPVKFWLFENYLSPSFKATAAALAAQYEFELGYVTYKWPDWLRGQDEKQRIIWGYKILFLDVLFPLDVRRVIYVDADQVVRGDLRELWDMDLHGKPYAFTPFCDSRPETLGYQFWRQGYWKDHLRGKPYHISALYVVDLVTFRARAVGDALRALYDNLSRDPNSLSNLDQDLPNYAQNMIPIHSLPTDWLWCESWCSDKSKETAKTIDLCNNPEHKENKLDMAKRVVDGPLFPESWVELDEEVKACERGAVAVAA